MMKKLIFLWSLLVLGWQTTYADGSPTRERVNINRDWHYQENDPAGVDSTLHYSRLRSYLLPCANDFFYFWR